MPCRSLPPLGFGERDTGAARAGGQLGQEATLLLVGAVAGDHPARQRVAADDAGDAHPRPRDLLEHDGQRHHVEALTTVFLGDRHAEEADLLHDLDDLVGIAVGVLPLAGHGSDVRRRRSRESSVERSAARR